MIIIIFQKINVEYSVYHAKKTKKITVFNVHQNQIERKFLVVNVLMGTTITMEKTITVKNAIFYVKFGNYI